MIEVLPLSMMMPQKRPHVLIDEISKTRRMVRRRRRREVRTRLVALEFQEMSEAYVKVEPPIPSSPPVNANMGTVASSNMTYGNI
jgi:hypothetical protein